MIIAIANNKGGVGKTTTTLNLGWSLVQQQQGPILLVDTDPQASLTMTLGVDPGDMDLARVLEGRANILDAIRNVRPGLDLVPASPLLAETEVTLVGRFKREQILDAALQPAWERYTHILIDVAPSISLLTYNALVAAQEVIAPLHLDSMAIDGLALLMGTLATVRRGFPESAHLLGTVATMADLTSSGPRSLHAREMLAALRSRADLRMFDAIIPRSVRFAEAAAMKQPIGEYEPSQAGALAYAAFAQEVLQRAATA